MSKIKKNNVLNFPEKLSSGDREVEAIVFAVSSGFGWYLAILTMSTIRYKLRYSNYLYHQRYHCYCK